MGYEEAPPRQPAGAGLFIPCPLFPPTKRAGLLLRRPAWEACWRWTWGCARVWRCTGPTGACGGTARRTSGRRRGCGGGCTGCCASCVLEGGGNLAEIWTREAERIGITVHRIAAETWRERLL